MDGASTAGGVEDANDLALEDRRSDYDQRHNFFSALIWNVNYYSGPSRLLKNVLNGWTISPIVTLSSGFPFTVSAGKDNNLDGVTNDRANIVGNPLLDPHRSRPQVIAQWFNTAAFATSPLGTDGNSERNLLDGPGIRNVDMGFSGTSACGRGPNFRFVASSLTFSISSV